jgi:hypothetical protein
MSSVRTGSEKRTSTLEQIFLTSRRNMVKAIKSVRKGWKKIGATTTTVTSSHVAMLAQPSKVAAVIVDAAAKASSN